MRLFSSAQAALKLAAGEGLGVVAGIPAERSFRLHYALPSESQQVWWGKTVPLLSVAGFAALGVAYAAPILLALASLVIARMRSTATTQYNPWNHATLHGLAKPVLRSPHLALVVGISLLALAADLAYLFTEGFVARELVHIFVALLIFPSVVVFAVAGLFPAALQW